MLSVPGNWAKFQFIPKFNSFNSFMYGRENSNVCHKESVVEKQDTD